MNVVRIPRFHMVCEQGKEYTVFDISVTVHGRTHDVQKRYSELFYIHKLLKKQAVVPPFPPKQMRNHNTKVIESRRNGLQQYLQWIINYDPLCARLLDLLNIPHMYNSHAVQSMDSLDTGAVEVSHCPVITYKSDSTFLSPQNDFQESIVSGVLLALYKRS